MQTHHLKLSESRKNPLNPRSTQPPMVHKDNAIPTHHAQQAQSIQMDQTDLRWRFAARVQMTLGKHHQLQSITHYEALVDAAGKMGFSGIHARSMIGIVEEAQTRGGLDFDAYSQLASIPNASPVAHAMPTKLRWMTFGILFAWAFVIAGMMQLV